jgi:RNA polymerase sigma-70 factor, ECF subfamily
VAARRERAAHALRGSAIDAPVHELVKLLAATARRDQKAFARLYQLTAAKLFAIALRILRRRDWAEEVLQDCFVTVWHHAGQYNAVKSAPLTWMTTIVRNRCLDWLRRGQHEAESQSDEMFELIPDAAGGPLERVIGNESLSRVYRCLMELDPGERQTIALAFLHGLTHSELATHLKQPLGTVKTYVRRGLQRLRACLQR